MRRFAVVLTLILFPAVVAAQTVSVRDIVELSKAGLGEAALLALIEVNRPVFPVDTETLRGLKHSGVAPNVIIAMIKSGRTPPVLTLPASEPLQLPVPSDPPPQVVVVDHHHDEPRVREVAVPVPVYVLVHTRSRGSGEDDGPWPSRQPVSPRVPTLTDPLYWGWSGGLGPGTWMTAADVQKDARIPRSPQRK